MSSGDVEKAEVLVVEERTAERIAQWLEARGRAVLQTNHERAGHAVEIVTVIAAAVRAGDWRAPS